MSRADSARDTPAATWRLVTPLPGSEGAGVGGGVGGGAIAAVCLTGDIDGAASRLGLLPVRVGEVVLRDFGGIDRGIAARPSPGQLFLMPHAGPAVIARVFAWLRGAGLAPDRARADLPEAASAIEARMLEALAVAASPLAVDLLLDQPRRWAAHTGPDDEHASRRWAILNRLVHPPLVVALGPPNIGKSTLVNALAGRQIALVADQPGTTRDHVGVRLDLGGLVVDFVDAPGLSSAADPIQQEAQRLALHAAASAALILLCADPTTDLLDGPFPRIPMLRLCLRSDLGPPREPCNLSVSVRAGKGVEELVALVRDKLVPPGDLAHPGPWRFWDESIPST